MKNNVKDDERTGEEDLLVRTSGANPEDSFTTGSKDLDEWGLSRPGWGRDECFPS